MTVPKRPAGRWVSPSTGAGDSGAAALAPAALVACLALADLPFAVVPALAAGAPAPASEWPPLAVSFSFRAGWGCWVAPVSVGLVVVAPGAGTGVEPGGGDRLARGRGSRALGSLARGHGGCRRGACGRLRSRLRYGAAAGRNSQQYGRKNLQRDGCTTGFTIHRANNSFIPPAIRTDTSTNTRGKEIPPRATRYFASHTGSNFAL